MLDLLNCASSGRAVFSYPCPVGWDGLEETDDPRRRWCRGCARSVFHCHDANETALRAEQGECVAVPDWLAAGVRAREGAPRVLIVGQLSRRQQLTEIVEEHLAAHGKHEAP